MATQEGHPGRRETAAVCSCPSTCRGQVGPGSWGAPSGQLAGALRLLVYSKELTREPTKPTEMCDHESPRAFP